MDTMHVVGDRLNAIRYWRVMYRSPIARGLCPYLAVLFKRSQRLRGPLPAAERTHRNILAVIWWATRLVFMQHRINMGTLP